MPDKIAKDPVSDHTGLTYSNMLTRNLWTTRLGSFAPRLALIVIICMMMPLAVVAYPYSDMSCHDANFTCYMNEECRVRMELLKSTCGPYGEYCSLPQPTGNDSVDQTFVGFCQSALKSLKKLEPNLRCYCTLSLSSFEYSKCMVVWRFLEQHPCVENPRWPKPSPPDPIFIPNPRPSVHSRLQILGEKNELSEPTQLPVREQIKYAAAGQVSTIEETNAIGMSLAENDCLNMMRLCDEQPNCQLARKNFLRACQQSDVAQCSVHRTNCLAAYENVRHFHLFSCTCSGKHRSNDKCKQHQSHFERNGCLDYYESQSMFGIGVAEGQQKSSALGSVLPETELATSTIDDQPTNCYLVYKDCARSSTCLKRMVRMAESCHWNKDKRLCHNYTRCLEALSTFYTAHTGGMSSAAARCQCPYNDIGCLRQKEVFQPRCAYQPQAPLSCLQLYTMCQKDQKRCYVALNLYSRTCDVDTLARRCLNSSAECEKRRRIIWGTVLTLNCTCDLTESDDRNLDSKGFRATCHNIKQLLTNPPCLAPQNTVFSKPKTNFEAQREACLLIRDKYEENEVRLYHNKTCSQLCSCLKDKQVGNCRQLPCVNTAHKCQRPKHRKSENIDCKCIFGSLICVTKTKPSQQSPGLYLSIAYSLPERRAVDQHASMPINLEQMGNLISRMLSRTIGAHLQCQLQLTQQDAPEGQALFRVNSVLQQQVAASGQEPLWSNARVRRSAAQLTNNCHYPLRLLKILIDRGYPEITQHPHLSVVKAARVFIVDEPATKTENRYSEYAQRPKDAVNNVLGVLVPENQGDRGSSHKQEIHFLLFFTSLMCLLMRLTF